ncbi:MAG TPA: bifunctional metallophosphatase/5'-nucleotidase [Pseudonocardiaceae bacterium]
MGAGQGLASKGSGTNGTLDVRLIGLNDLHGNLEPPSGSSGLVTIPGQPSVPAGGASYIATHIQQLKSQVPHSYVVGQGDMIGASPLASALFHDEPTIEFLNQVGMTTSSAGNHEFDEGYLELLRVQTGGCHPEDGCQFHNPYRGAKFPFLGANVVFKGSGLPALPPFWLSYANGIPVGYIGMPLKGTPEIVAAAGIKDLEFKDEITSANKYARLLDLLGVKTIVLVLHQGDPAGAGGPNDCNNVAGPGRVIAEGVSSKIDVVFGGHSHQQFNCTVNDPAGKPRPYIQGLSFGRILSVVDLKVDRRTKDVIRDQTVANNHIVTRDVPMDAAAEALVQEAKTKSAPIANRPIGAVSADILRAAVPSGESALGNLIADAQLAGTQAAGAQIALMNPGGVRSDLTYASGPAGEGDGVVTYGEAFTVQPFGNVMTTITLTGAQIKAVLEQQWQPTTTRILQPSAGFTYTWSQSAPVGSKISDIELNGTPIDPAASYRVSVNNFLADGGDGFTALRDGTNRVGGAVDLDAFTDYLEANAPVGPPATNRITRVA